MKTTLKKTGVALLVATLTIAGSSYAWADEIFFTTEEISEPLIEVEQPIDTTPVESTVATVNEDSVIPDDTTAETTEESTTPTPEEPVLTETPEEPVATPSEETAATTEKSEFPEIPAGYTAGNLLALKQAYEHAGNDTAKAAILRNAKRAIDKFETKQKNTEADNKEIILEKSITKEPVAVQPPVEEQTKHSLKEERKAIQEQQKIEHKELQEQHKAEKKALKEEQKAEKKNGKNKE